MGFGIVDIWKIAEQGNLVTYAYEHERGGGDFTRGEFTINRTSGEVAHSGTEPGHAGYAAQHRIIKAWRQGELPHRTQWAG